MASSLECGANRPNSVTAPTMPAKWKILLANPEPSAHGPDAKSSRALKSSTYRGGRRQSDDPANSAFDPKSDVEKLQDHSPEARRIGPVDRGARNDELWTPPRVDGEVETRVQGALSSRGSFSFAPQQTAGRESRQDEIETLLSAPLSDR
jgi:hypothetical protein